MATNLKIGDLVRAIVNNEEPANNPEVIPIIREELLKMSIRDSLAELKGATGHNGWKMKMSKLIESGCLLNGD